MKRFFVFGLTLFLLVPALASAATGGKYRIDLRDGSHLFSTDRPVQRGTVVTFHPAAGGALTGLPAEQILSIQTGSSEVKASQAKASRQPADAGVRGRMTAVQTLAQPLQPGEVLVLGPTGGGSAQAMPNGASGASTAGAGNANGANSGYGSTAVPPGFAANGQPFVPAAGDLARAPSAGAPPTMGPDGFPLGGNATTTNVGPNGTPIVVQPGANAGQPVVSANGTPVTSGAPQPIIGPNGTPVVAPSGTAGAAQPVIGPNGTPVLAQPGTPGAAQPVIGPNGTPVLAQPGTPGSAPPNIAPNGTPATGQPGTPSSAQPNTAPNGTPAAPAPGGGASPK